MGESEFPIHNQTRTLTTSKMYCNTNKSLKLDFRYSSNYLNYSTGKANRRSSNTKTMYYLNNVV